MGSSLVGMRSLRVSPRRSVASGFYCSVNRAGKKTVHATHVENPRNSGASIKNVCAGKLVEARCQPHRTGYSSETWGGRRGRGSGWRIFFFSSSRIQLKDFVLLNFCPMRSFFFSLQGKNNDNWCHLDRQTDGVRCNGTKAETVIHGVLYPRSPLWNQVVVSVEITITNRNWLSFAGKDIFIILLRKHPMWLF